MQKSFLNHDILGFCIARFRLAIMAASKAAGKTGTLQLADAISKGRLSRYADKVDKDAVHWTELYLDARSNGF